MVLLLLLVTLKVLVSVRHKDQVGHVAKDGVMLLLAAHGDDAVLETARVLANDD